MRNRMIVHLLQSKSPAKRRRRVPDTDRSEPELMAVIRRSGASEMRFEVSLALCSTLLEVGLCYLFSSHRGLLISHIGNRRPSAR